MKRASSQQQPSASRQLYHSTIRSPRKASASLSSRNKSTFSYRGYERAALPVTAMATSARAAEAVHGGNPTLELDLSASLTLSNIRQSLIRQEDTIIFNLIERAQFARNDAIYQRGGIPIPVFLQDGRQLSFLEYLLRETEQIHGKIRRYTSPDEAPYFPDCVPPLVIPPMSYPQVLAPCGTRVNINNKILSMYLEHLLPEITQAGDDHNYGSSAMYDVMILQALSKRIHYGKFVAEAKFQAQTEKYTRLIKERDGDAILELLTDRAVELKVIERVRRKAATFGQDLDALPNGQANDNGNAAATYKIKPEAVAELYEQWVMPLTKEVEVEYLLLRLDD